MKKNKEKEMITLKNSTIISDQLFLDCYTKISNSNKGPSIFLLRWRKLRKAVLENHTLYSETKDQILDKFGTDKYKLNELSEDKKKEILDELKPILEEKFTLGLPKIDYPEVLELTPLEFDVMEDIFDYSKHDEKVLKEAELEEKK